MGILLNALKKLIKPPVKAAANPPTPGVDYATMVSTEQVLAASKDIYSQYHFYEQEEEDLTQPQRRRNRTSKSILDNSADAETIIEFLQNKMGFRRLSSNIRNGFFALVMEGNDYQMLRLDLDLDARLPPPLILQPLIPAFVFDKYRVEVLPKVHTLAAVMADPRIRHYYNIPQTEVTRWHRNVKTKLFADLKKCGLEQCDASIGKDDNIAVVKDKNGKPQLLILDANAVKIVDYDRYQRVLKGTRLTRDYAAMQTAHLDSLGLTAGQVKGVLNKRQLEEELAQFITERSNYLALTSQYKPQETVYYSALSQGVSPGEFSHAAKTALKQHADRKNEGFCQLICEQLKSHNIRNI